MLLSGLLENGEENSGFFPKAELCGKMAWKKMRVFSHRWKVFADGKSAGARHSGRGFNFRAIRLALMPVRKPGRRGGCERISLEFRWEDKGGVIRCAGRPREGHCGGAVGFVLEVVAGGEVESCEGEVVAARDSHGACLPGSAFWK